MDAVTLALAKRYTDGQRMGYEEHIKFFGSMEKDKEPDMVVAGVEFICRSPMTPTKKELANSKFYVGYDPNSLYPNPLPAVVAFDDGVLYGVALVGANNSVAGYFIVAYKSGTQTVSVNGYPMEIYIPKTGIYVAVVEGTGGLYTEWTHIEEIDPKFIPPLDSVTLNSPSGKKFAVTVDDTGALTATEVSS